MRPSLRAIRTLPKADLHSHIDGSVSPRELFRIAQRHGRKLKAPKGEELDSISALMAHVVGGGYGSMLDNIVDRFFPITGLMQTEETIREVGISYLEGQKRDGVAYVEGRFAPQYHTREGLSLRDVIRSMAAGLAEGAERFGVETALIVGIGREVSPNAGRKVAEAAAGSGLVTALDLCGPEAGNPSSKFTNAFGVAKASGLKLTVHAGEGAGSMVQNLRNMEDAILLLGADRLGHAIPLAGSDKLLKLVLERHVAVEMNPVSNLVLGNIKSLEDLALDRLLRLGVDVSVNSDDPALWPRGHLPDAYFQVCRAYGFGFKELDRLVSNSFEGSFASRRGKERLAQAYCEARRKTELTG